MKNIFSCHAHYTLTNVNFLLTSISVHTTVSLPIVLHGDSMLSFDINSVIFEAVQKYFKDTKRF